ncbi:AIPR family protein [Helicobacter cetorum]|uniref:Abortive phage infection protein C-terminal domain-containing protein n=1 Tax=Helicobacter cetorum (strain ATCC BAA-429 / MIT 00-7128) TaxID=182217 RepID=I0EMX1_HELC0|nr:AIPR family protein [Helicobacter cetorum]AFI04290.1 hypothetical protein HCW_05115 [Helicobacter cetorum MIT 00-7128]
MKTKLERYVGNFINDNFDKADQEKSDYLKFEWFVNSMHCFECSSQSYNQKTTIGKEISLGAAEGGDAFFLLVGNKIYSAKDNVDEINEEIKKNKNRAELHLIQVKKSSHAKLGDFKNFVEIPIKLIKKEGISEKQKELQMLANFIREILNDNPEAVFDFVLTFYTEKNENDIKRLREEWCEDIEYVKNRYVEYGEASIRLEGSLKLQNLYEKFISNDYKLIIDKSHAKLEDNYLIGFLSAEELLNCIAPETDNKRILYPDVFKNNIRLYLGNTEVNQKIEETLKEEPKKFHLYNNGLTITTKDTSEATRSFIVAPVNIVNGCQTANNIYNVFKEHSLNISNVKIPVKIIKASDDEYEKITIRTNTQNGISEKDLVSINDIQKDLENVLAKERFQGKTFLYKRQNAKENDNKADYIVKIDDVLRAFFSSVLYLPHKVSGYFDKTTSALLDIVFEDRLIKLYQIVVSLYKALNKYIEMQHPHFSRMRYHVFYLLYKFINKDIEIDNLEKYFVKDKVKKNFEELTNDELKKQDELINSIYSNLYQLNDKSKMDKIVDYLIDTLKEKYPDFIDIDTREKEKILYRTVDKTQRGEQLFKNFEENFNKNIEDIVNEIN